MPRGNRYILPGYVYHLTHRCHNRSFLFKFARDRTEYRRRLREAVEEFEISVLTYNVTSNHVHLFLRAKDVKSISAFMQKQEGEFAEYYNWRRQTKSVPLRQSESVPPLGWLIPYTTE